MEGFEKIMVFVPVFFVFLPIVTAIIMFLVKPNWIHSLVFVLQAVLMILFIVYVVHLQTYPDDALLIFGGYDARIAISFYADTLNLTFVGLTIFMFFVVMYYSFKANRKEKKYFFFLTFLEGVFIGLLLTNDLFNLFVFLELMSLLVTILIAYKKVEQSLKAGLQYLLISSIAAMMYLLGVMIIYYVFGTINIRLVTEAMPLYQDTMLMRFAYALMLAAFMVKGAFFPVYAWLPKAHGVAQSSISALLSGLIVKVALYLIMRLHGIMFLAPYGFSTVLLWVGFISSFLGVLFAMSQKDVKQVLAYHTVSQVGLMLIGVSFAQGTSFIGGWLHIVNHALFKSLLFLSAGVIIKVYGTKKVADIRGVFKTLPWTGTLFLIGILGITGAPLLNGFISKTMIKYAFQDDPFFYSWFQLIHLGTMVSFIKLSLMLFGQAKQPVSLSKSSYRQHIPMTFLALVMILIGTTYQPLFEFIFNITPYDVQILSFNHILEYALYGFVGFSVYWLFIQKDYRPTKLIRDFTMSFPTTNMWLVVMIVLFLGLTLR
jgi:multicomponent Na+:H+ antiporter subunit D